MGARLALVALALAGCTGVSPPAYTLGKFAQLPRSGAPARGKVNAAVSLPYVKEKGPDARSLLFLPAAEPSLSLFGNHYSGAFTFSGGKLTAEGVVSTGRPGTVRVGLLHGAGAGWQRQTEASTDDVRYLDLSGGFLLEFPGDDDLFYVGAKYAWTKIFASATDEDSETEHARHWMGLAFGGVLPTGTSLQLAPELLIGREWPSEGDSRSMVFVVPTLTLSAPF